MHPDGHWISPEEKDSIAKAHMRLDNLFATALERIGSFYKPTPDLTYRPWKGGARRYGRNGSGKWLRRGDPMAATTSMVGALHHRLLWMGTYINNGALDEQISHRVRYEAIHFWNALEEAILKLKALVVMGERVDIKLRAIDEAIAAFDVQQHVMNDAVPARYKLAVTRLQRAIKRALAA